MGKLKEHYFDAIERNQLYQWRKKPFLSWAQRNNPSLYEALTNGRIRFKDKWLAPLPDKKVVPYVSDDVPF